MNKDNLHELINRYEKSMDSLYGSEHDELFKWRATKTWRDEWFKPKEAYESFIDRYNAAKKNFSLFIDNSRMHPAAGVVKMWEIDPVTIESLFNDVLFTETNGDITTVQNNMDCFLDRYEELRQRLFPRNWSYKMDRHAASVYLAMNDPQLNYVYKSSEAQAMAKYTGFELSIGFGIDFSLKSYYKLCEEVVSALKEHDSLLRKHFERLTDEFYYDTSLHLLAFDLMYCSWHYYFYDGLIVPVAGKSAQKNKKHSGMIQEEETKKEAERLAEIQAIESEIEKLEISCEEYADISLVGVEVTTEKYGVGIVISQEINNVTVKFENSISKFELDKKYFIRPRFENDEAIIEALTEYGKIKKQIDELEKRLRCFEVEKQNGNTI